MDKKLFIAAILMIAILVLPFTSAAPPPKKPGSQPSNPAIPQFQYYCQKGSTKVKFVRMFSTTWYSMKLDRLTGKITNSPCTYGCNKATGLCYTRKQVNSTPGTNFKWKCEGSFFHRNTKSVRINLDTGEKDPPIDCKYGCDSSTGWCRQV
ncbi:MAG: hypothetical protein V1493_06740 [Candidatus Diapherotrites archaeon]